MKFLLLFLMFAVLSIAFILPKFVQRSELTDLKQAEEPLETEILEEPIAQPSPLRGDSRFSDFFNALDNKNFDSARASFLTLSGDISEEEKTELTSRMELAVTSLSEPSNATIASTSDSPDFKPLAQIDSVNDSTLSASPEKTESPAKDNQSEERLMASFMADVQENDFKAAKEKLSKLTKSVDSETAAMLASALATAETRESYKHNHNPDQAITSATSNTNALEPLDVPSTFSTSFESNSTVLSGAKRAELLTAVELLKEEPRLSLQLRGYADSVGSSQYNAILSQARSEIVRDYFLEQGISGKRITVISFGETQAEIGSEKNPRRVDIVFREL